jgi:peptidoglycan/LPS O-acetylase OafA/YrhL
MLNALTGLRAFAAAWVVFYHFRADIKLLFPTADFAWPLLDSGYAGVDVFFVLSGFIISYTYLERLRRPGGTATGKFLWYRLARIYPVHLFTLALFAFIVAPGNVQDASLADITANITSEDFYRQILLLHAWGTDGNHAWNYPAWSISSEWFAYLLFPVAALGLVRVRRAGAAAAGFVAAHAFNIATFAWIAAAGYQGDIILVRIVGEFAAGCFLFLLWQRGWGFSLPWAILTPLVGVAAGVVTMWVASVDEAAPVVAAPLYSAFIYGLAVDRGVLVRLLATRALVYAGEASYALYMTHAIVQRFTWEYLPATDYAADGRLIRLGILGAYAALLALAAILTYELVERPSRDWMRQALSRLPRPRQRAADPVIGRPLSEEPISGRTPTGGA